MSKPGRNAAWPHLDRARPHQAITEPSVVARGDQVGQNTACRHPVRTRQQLLDGNSVTITEYFLGDDCQSLGLGIGPFF